MSSRRGQPGWGRERRAGGRSANYRRRSGNYRRPRRRRPLVQLITVVGRLIPRSLA